MNPLKINSELKRYPFQKRDLLQAWDSADELLLKHLSGIGLAGKRILILGDRFGALGCALEGQDVTTFTDSYVSYQGVSLNSRGRLRPVNDLSGLSGFYDLVLIRIPKNMSFFEDMLCRISRHLTVGAQVVCGYMVKHQANASFELLDRLVGPTRTSLAEKKARLIFAVFERSSVDSPYPLQVSISAFKYPFVNHSNLFSREGLDIGTRFLLEHLPRGDFKTILDLGCANGIVGIAAKQMNPGARIVFSDESQMAIQSARANYRTYFADEAEFVWTNCFENQTPESIDLVLCNPPFHQGNTQGEFIARQMFADARNVLVRGGMLRVIGNLHLRHPSSLKRIFGNSRVVARNRKFEIVDAVKSS